MRRFVFLLACLTAVAPPHASVGARPQDAAAAATLQGEAMYAVPSKQMWEHVQAVVKASGFRPDKRDVKHQLLVTEWRDYDAKLLPSTEALDLPGKGVPLRIQLHFLVAPGREPARVALGSVIEFVRAQEKSVKLLAYRNAAMDKWLFAALDARAGATHQEMAGTWDGRKAQAAKLLPAGATDRCLSASPAVPPDAIQRLVPIGSLNLVFPAEGVDKGARTVSLDVQLTEHGTLSHLKIVNPSEKFALYESSARAAAGLWRFEPVLVAGCPVAAPLSLEIDYMVR